MEFAAYATLGLGVAAVLVAGVRLVRLQRAAADLDARARDVAARVRALPPDLAGVPGGGIGGGERRVLVVELLDPFGLASTRTWLARPLAAMAPRLLHRVVHDQAALQIREKAAELGIRADVRVHRVE